MKSKIKGCTHHESKVIKMAEGGSVPAKDRKVLKTTRTADGGQQYVRDDYKVASDAEKKYYKRVYKNEILSPKASKALAKATYYAMNPDDKSGFPERMGKISEEGAEAQNKITRDIIKRKRRGD
jgi:hypothetical protein